MSNLRAYLFKNVCITTTDGECYNGFVDTYTSAADNEDTEESIGVIPSRTAKAGVELFASEIRSIEMLN